MSERSRPKHAAFKFVQAYLTNPTLNSKEPCFAPSDLFGDEATGIVKVYLRFPLCLEHCNYPTSLRLMLEVYFLVALLGAPGLIGLIGH